MEESDAFFGHTGAFEKLAEEEGFTVSAAERNLVSKSYNLPGTAAIAAVLIGSKRVHVAIA